MKTILMSATACLPNSGSEAGVGWNVVKNMSHYYNVIVFTRENNKQKIQEYLSLHPVANLHFEYYDIPKCIRWIFFTKKKLFRNRALVYDFIWHLMSIPKFKKIAKQSNAVLAHHVNQCQYRILSPCYALKIPTVYGPLGGAETLNTAFYQDLEKKTINKENKRRKGKDRALFLFYQKISDGKKVFLFSCRENYNRLKDYVLAGSCTRIVPSIAYEESAFSKYKMKAVDKSKPFTLIYAGKLFDWKGIELFLKAANRAFDKQSNVIIRLIGIRDEDDKKKVKSWIDGTDIVDKIEMIDFMPHDELIRELIEADLFVYPAFRDSGAMAVLEACALGCPTICFDAGGQDIFPDDMILKVKVYNSYRENQDAFSEKLFYAFTHREEIHKMGNAIQRYVREHFTWQNKIQTFLKIYDEILDSSCIK